MSHLIEEFGEWSSKRVGADFGIIALPFAHEVESS
jgi:hypothetical protein